MYDEKGEDLCKHTYKAYAYDPYLIPIDRDLTPYRDYVKYLSAMGAMLVTNAELIGRDRPIFQSIGRPRLGQAQRTICRCDIHVARGRGQPHVLQALEHAGRRRADRENAH